MHAGNKLESREQLMPYTGQKKGFDTSSPCLAAAPGRPHQAPQTTVPMSPLSSPNMRRLTDAAKPIDTRQPPSIDTPTTDNRRVRQHTPCAATRSYTLLDSNNTTTAAPPPTSDPLLLQLLRHPRRMTQHSQSVYMSCCGPANRGRQIERATLHHTCAQDPGNTARVSTVYTAPHHCNLTAQRQTVPPTPTTATRMQVVSQVVHDAI